MRIDLLEGDCRYNLELLDDNSIDSVVTDPPYALVSITKRFGKEGAAPCLVPEGGSGAYARASAGFMGKQWDTGETAFAVGFWREVLRVLKPGGHVVAFSGTRTYHRLACAIEDAGFEIRDQLAWTYGTGFPKSHDVSKGIDKLDAADARRERQLRFTAWIRSTGLTSAQINEITETNMGSHYTTSASQPAVATRAHFEKLRPFIKIDVPSWVEEMVDERTVESENFKRREVIDSVEMRDTSEVRIAVTDSALDYDSRARRIVDVTAPATDDARQWDGWGTALKPAWEPIVLARKPLVGTVAVNVIAYGTGAINIDGSRIPFSSIADEKELKSKNQHADFGSGAMTNQIYGQFGRDRENYDPPGRWPANILHDGSDEVSLAFGEAIRFFYCAKASKGDRAGSKHPTVKPVALMRWLCRLVTPPGGVVLDPFAGSGTTGQAAREEGFSAILCEREAEYIADIKRRLELDLPEFML